MNFLNVIGKKEDYKGDYLNPEDAIEDFAVRERSYIG